MFGLQTLAICSEGVALRQCATLASNFSVSTAVHSAAIASSLMSQRPSDNMYFPSHLQLRKLLLFCVMDKHGLKREMLCISSRRTPASLFLTLWQLQYTG